MPRKRVLVVALFIFSLFSLLLIQYYKIQCIEYAKWSGFAAKQHELVVPQVAKRGGFYGKVRRIGLGEYSQPFVYDLVKHHLFADPLSLPQEIKHTVSQKLSEILEIDSKQIEKEINRSVRSRRVASWLTKEQKEEVEKWWRPFAKAEKIPSNALFFLRDFKRCYPFGSLLGQVLHTIRDQKDELTKEGVPTGGLEAHFNHLVKGKQGKRVLLRSPLNCMDTDRVVSIAEDGADVYLTIDPYLQQIVEEELEKGVQSAKAVGGWAVMMDSASGEILALGQYPPFDPGDYRTFFNDPQMINHTKVRALTDCFELGSIMKPITLGISMMANEERALQGKPPLFSPDERIDVTRRLFPGRGNKPIKDGIDRLALDMNMAIQKSSNIYMAQLAERIVTQMGDHWYREKLVQGFGFGVRSGLELPAESPGLVPSPGRIYPNGRPQWSLATPYSISFGYNILANSVQMLRAFAVFANRGELVSPTLIRKIVKEGKEILLQEKEPSKRVLSQKGADRIVEAIKFSTKPGGTGWRAEIPGYSEAGKTGTAEKIIEGKYSKKIHISSFIGFSPAKKTEHIDPIVLIVSIDEPAAILVEGIKNYLGGKCAAPVFKNIMMRSLEYLGVPPDDPCGYSKQDPRFDSVKADHFSQLAELSKKYKEFNP